MFAISAIINVMITKLSWARDSRKAWSFSLSPARAHANMKSKFFICFSCLLLLRRNFPPPPNVRFLVTKLPRDISTPTPTHQTHYNKLRNISTFSNFPFSSSVMKYSKGNCFYFTVHFAYTRWIISFSDARTWSSVNDVKRSSHNIWLIIKIK